MIVVQVYACESCGTEYRTSQEAQECEARAAANKPSVKVGDIVTARAGLGWYDGDRKWVSNATQVERGSRDWKVRGSRDDRKRKCPNGDDNCFSDCCTYSFFYVVTHIDSDDFGGDSLRRHRPRYHLMTLAMTAEAGYGGGYTFDEGHCKPTLAKRVPKSVRCASRSLIGKKATRLV